MIVTLGDVDINNIDDSITASVTKFCSVHLSSMAVRRRWISGLNITVHNCHQGKSNKLIWRHSYVGEFYRLPSVSN